MKTIEQKAGRRAGRDGSARWVI